MSDPCDKCGTSHGLHVQDCPVYRATSQAVHDAHDEALRVIGAGGPWKPAPSSTPFALSVTCPICGAGPNRECASGPYDPHPARAAKASGISLAEAGSRAAYEYDLRMYGTRLATDILGFRAWALRHSSGYWCGYLEVPKDVTFDGVRVHGADSCGNGINIAYTPKGEPGFSEGVAPGHIVYGFDCGHLGDWKPEGVDQNAVYRPLSFVNGELVKMAVAAQAEMTTARYLKAGVVTQEEVDRSKEKVDHPAHYGGIDNPYEAIKVMEGWHGKDAVRMFCILTAEKYLSRAGKKDGEPIERDLAKARWYIDHAIKMGAP